jgi:hypothetical protein
MYYNKKKKKKKKKKAGGIAVRLKIYTQIFFDVKLFTVMESIRSSNFSTCSMCIYIIQSSIDAIQIVKSSGSE